MGFAETSAETVGKTLKKGIEKSKAAAQTMMHQSARNKFKRDEDNELNLLGSAEEEADGIDRLDNDEERPFQSFASQMKNFAAKAKSSVTGKKKQSDDKAGDYTRLEREPDRSVPYEESKHLMDDMERIKDKEQALDAEN